MCFVFCDKVTQSIKNAAEYISDCVFSYPRPDGGLLKAETSTVSWMLHHLKYKLCLIFGILKAWKCDSSSVLRPSAKGYVTIVEPYYNITL